MKYPGQEDKRLTDKAYGEGAYAVERSRAKHGEKSAKSKALGKKKEHATMSYPGGKKIHGAAARSVANTIPL